MPPGNDSLDRAIAALVTYAEGITDVPTFQALLLYAHRRFGVTEFGGALDLYDRETTRAGERVFRRIVDGGTVAAAADLATLSDTDVMVAAALYCDVVPLPPDFPATLDAGREEGGYWLTHVLLSLELLRENGCADVVPEPYNERVATEVAGLVGPVGPPTDLEIEAQAFLSLVGRGDLMQPGFVERLLEAQNQDGGFSATGQEGAGSRWHASGLALWVLLSARHPEAPLRPFIAR